MADWSPEQYERFKQQRSQPFYDLLALVERGSVATVVDLGCGTGELTRVLADELGATDVLGVDSSVSMLEKSASFVRPGLRFEQREIESFAPPQPCDLLFSNAALHWVEDHEATVWPQLAAALAAGGQLAVQVPANHDQPSFLAAAEVARDPRFAAALDGYAGHRNVLAPESYARLMHALGFARQQVRLHVYLHELPGVDAVVEWVKGTTLTPFAARLGGELFGEFLAAYRARLIAMAGERSPYPFAFKRILIWGRR